MKRILSVILSLALLASLLIVPMSVSAVTEAEKAAYKDVINAVANLKCETTNNPSLLELAVPIGSNKGSNNDGVDHVEVFGENGKTVDNCMELVDADTLAANPGLGSQAVKVYEHETPKPTAWGTDPNNTIRYTLDGKTQDRGIRLYDIGYIVIYVKTNVNLKFTVYNHNRYAKSAIAEEKSVAAKDGVYQPIVLDLTAINWTDGNYYNLRKCLTAIENMRLLVLSLKKDDGTAISENDDIVFGSMKYVPVEKAVRDFKFDTKKLNGYTVQDDGSVKIDNTTNESVSLRYHTAKSNIDFNDSETVADIIARAETISNADGRYTANSFKDLQDAISAAKTAFITNSENKLAILKAEAQKLYKTEEIAQPLFKGNKPTTKDNIDDFGLTEYQKDTLGSHYTVVNGGDTDAIYYVKPGASSHNPGSEYNIKLQDYDEVILPVYNNSAQKKFSGSTFQTGVTLSPTSGPKNTDNQGYYVALNSSLYGNITPVVHGFNIINVKDLLVKVGYSNLSSDLGYNNNKTERYFKDYNHFYEYNGSTNTDTNIATGLGCLPYDLMTNIRIDMSDSGVSKLKEGQSWILGTMTGKKYFKLSDDMINEDSVEALVVALNNEVTNGGYANTAAIEKTLDIIGVPPVITIEGNKANDTEDYCGSVKVTVTDPNDDLTDVLVYTDGSSVPEDITEVLEERPYPLTAGSYKIEAYDANDNEATVSFTIVKHDLVYKAEGAVITEECSKCDHDATLELVTLGDIFYDTTNKTGLIDAQPSVGFVGTKSEITFKKADGTEISQVIDIGHYTAEVTVVDATVVGENAVLEFEVEKPNDPNYEDYLPSEELIRDFGVPLSSIELPRIVWKNPTDTIKLGKQKYDATYVPENKDYREVPIQIEVTGKDDTPPTGTIKINETVWDKITNVLFGWFIDEKVTVTIEGSDGTGSGVDKIYYYVADAELNSFENIEWKEYTKEFKIEKEGNNVVYAKIVDVAGESTTINTDGIVLDTINPDSTIDLDTYYGALNFTVNEANLASVQVKDADSTSEPKDVPVKDGVYTVKEPGEKVIIITDKAGRKAEYKVNIIEIKGFDPVKDEAITINVDLDENNVETADMEKIAKKIDEDKYVLSFFQIDVKKITDNSDVTTTNSVFEIPVEFDFEGKLDIKVLHNHVGKVNELGKLDARPTADYETGKFFADVENKLLYIYTKEFSTFAVAFHVHDLDHVKATSATAEADGNIEYWYCEGCDKYFSDAIATKEITEESTFVKYAGATGGNTSGGSNTSGETTGTGDANTGTTLPGGISPGTGETAMTVVLFAILLGAIAVMGISIVKSRKAKSK